MIFVFLRNHRHHLLGQAAKKQVDRQNVDSRSWKQRGGSVAHGCPGSGPHDRGSPETPRTLWSPAESRKHQCPPAFPQQHLGRAQSLELFRSEGNHFTRTKQWVISPILHSNSQSPKHFNAMTGYEKKYLFQ